MKPNFFIVGAPRCGSTALSRYLAAHPKICFSKPKEPHYFSTVSSNCSIANVQTDYLARFFAHWRPEHTAIGEGSVSYLFVAEAIGLILQLNPQAKFIVMVRNPREMIPSYHFRLLFTMDEEVEDFVTAWALQGDRRQGKHIPRHCRDPRLLQYEEIGRLGEHVERLYQLAGPERCFVVVFDDFVTHTQQVYRQVLRFLEVEDDGRTHFPPKQASKGYRVRWLHRWLYRPHERVGRFVESLERPKTGNKGGKPFVKRARKFLQHLNTVERRPPLLPSSMIETLREAFRKDIEKLGYLLGRDLSHWQ